MTKPVVAFNFLLLMACLWVFGDSLPKNVVHLAWFYKPPQEGGVDIVARNFDVFILTHADEPFRNALKAHGVRVPYLQYLRFDAIEDPGTCSAKPHRNQVAYLPGDFCKVKSDHPDWFLYGYNHKPIVNDNYYLMDPGNREWREFFLKRALQTQRENGWDGVFLDNVEGGLAKRFQKLSLPERYDQPGYRLAISGFLQYLHENIRAAQKQLWANIIAIEDPKVWDLYLANLDGAMYECFAMDWDSGYRAPEEWEGQLARVEKIQSSGKGIILVSQGSQSDLARQQFAFASYLLVANGLASFRYADARAYRYAWIYPNYRLNLGAPVGARYYEDGFWRRKFTNGIVSVNPATHRALFNLR